MFNRNQVSGVPFNGAAVNITSVLKYFPLLTLAYVRNQYILGFPKLSNF